MNNNQTDRNDPIVEKLAAYHAELRSNPKNGSIWLKYGDFVDEEYEMPDEVVRAYENATKLLPKKDLRLRMGEAYLKAGEADKGITLIKASVSENPRPQAFCYLADAYLRLSDYESAKQAAEEAINQDPDFEEGYYLLGEAIRHHSREDAVNCFRAAVARNEAYGLAWQALGRELAASEDTINESVAALRKAIELDSQDGWAMAYLANALWRLERTDEADTWYQRAIAVFPDCEEMKRWYAQFRSEG